MNELRVVRGTDIRLFADGTPLFGITSFTAEEKPKFHEVYEYLNTKPCERIPQGVEYVICIGMMALFDRQLSECDGFSLTLVDGNVSYRYDGCHIVGRKTRLDGNDMATEEFTLKADQMTKQVTENE